MIYGIDLGTTNSCVAGWDEDFDRPQLLKNVVDGGANVTPSVVYFDPTDASKCSVGATAVNLSKHSPKDVVRGVKRHMGDNDSFDPTRSKFPYGKDPEFISAIILKKLIEDVKDGYRQEVREAVITVPAYFGALERMHTVNAGKLAGLDEVHIINEPTAAALAYGAYKKENQTVLVFDLGGGTFDVTFVHIFKRPDGTTFVDEIAKDGSANLGGLDWDRLLAQELLDAYNQKYCTNYRLTKTFSSNSDDEKITTYLLFAAEEYKKMLSNRDNVRWSFAFNGKDIMGEINRSTFDALTKSLLDKTMSMTRGVLEAAKKKNFDMPDKIILVGGSTRMKQVSETIRKEFGKAPELFEPDEAVALGAAVYAANLGKIEEGKSGDNIDTALSKTYGIYVRSGEVCNVLFKNDKLPIHHIERDRFATSSDDQSVLGIHIYESDLERSFLNKDVSAEDVPEKCKKIADTEIRFNQSFPANTPISFIFNLSNEQLMTIEAEINGESQSVEVSFVTGLSEGEQEYRRRQIGGTDVN